MWDKDGWPKVGENGKISPVMDGPLPAPGQSGKQDEFVDCFEEKNFDLCYNFLRNPQMEQYVRDSQHGELLLKGNGISLNDGKIRPGLESGSANLTCAQRPSCP